MDSGTILSLILIVVFLVLSAFFSATETAFNCLSQTRLKDLAEKGDRKAEKTLKLVEQYDRLLTSILVGNNVVNIAMASAGTVLFLIILPNIGASVSTLVITVLVLIFGEISPKTIAREHPEGFAMAVTPVMNVLVRILTPVNFLFSKWQDMLRKLFHLSEEKSMTQDELTVLVKEVAREGSIDEEEGDLLRNALEFEAQDAENVLTPRVDMVAISADAKNKEAARLFAKRKHSKIPVYEGSVDHVIGILYQMDFYTETGISDKPIRSLMRKPVFVPSTMKIDDLLRIMKQKKTQIAVVTDEFGGTKGIVTMEDILEELVGEIWDEYDEEVEVIRKTGKGSYRIMGSADIDQVEEMLDLKLDSESATAAGWAAEQIKHIPQKGESFQYGGYTFTVSKEDGNRVLEIKAQRNAPEEEESNDSDKTADRDH